MTENAIAEQKYGKIHSLMYFWIISAVSLMILLFLQTVLFGYGPLSLRSWSWFFSTIFPFTAFVFALGKPISFQLGKKVPYGFAWSLSIFYIILVFFTFIIVSILRYDDIAWYDISYFWLAPVQAVVLYAIGLVGVSQQFSEPRDG
jgi:hypothetical protein